VDAVKHRTTNLNKLIIFNEDDIKLLLTHKVSISQLNIMKDRYCSLLSSGVTGDHCETAQGFGAVAGLRIAQSFLGSFVDLTSLFRTNVEIKGQIFDIDEAPLAAEVMRAGRRTNGQGFPAGTELYYPRIFAPDLNLNKEYKILSLLQDVGALRNIAGQKISELEKTIEEIGKSETKVKNVESNIEQLTTAISDQKSKFSNLLQAYCPRIPAGEREDLSGLEARLLRYCPGLAAEQRERVFNLAHEIERLEGDRFDALGALSKAQKALAELKAKRDELEAAFQKNDANPNNPVDDRVTQLKALDIQVDKFVAAIVETSAANGPNALTSYIKAENLQDVLQGSPDKKSFWLQLKVVKAGGNNRIKTNLVWDIFTGGNRVSHSGGVIVEYILFEPTGRAVTADTITQYKNYIKADKVRKLTTPDVDDIPKTEENVGKKSDESGKTKVAKGNE
jgi:hypothetical protein